MNSKIQFLLVAAVAMFLVQGPVRAQEKNLLGLEFTVQNLPELETMRELRVIRLAGLNADLAVGLHVRAELFRVYPTLNVPQLAGGLNPQAAALREVSVGTTAFQATAAPFQFEWGLDGEGWSALAPGLYRLKLVPDSGQKADLRRLVRGAASLPVAEQLFSIGTKRQAFQAMRAEWKTLSQTGGELNGFAKEIEAALRAGFASEEETLFNRYRAWSLSLDPIYKRLLAASGVLQVNVQVGVMPDAYQEAAYWFEFYRNERVGAVNFGLSKAIEARAETVNIETYAAMLRPDLELFLLDAHACREIPFHMMFYLEDVIHSMHQRCMEFARMGGGPLPAREEFESDWDGMFGEVEALWSEYQSAYTDAKIDGLLAQAESNSRKLPRNGVTLVPGGDAVAPAGGVAMPGEAGDEKPKGVEEIVVLIRNIDDFLRAFRNDENNFRTGMNEYVKGLRDLRLLYAELLDQQETPEAVESKTADVRKELAKTREAMMKAMRLQLDFPAEELADLDAGGLAYMKEMRKKREEAAAQNGGGE